MNISKNYFKKKDKSLENIMNKYKTFKSYGQKTIKLNNTMYEP